jgi:polyisoprenoid-binding protein YceI
MTGRTLSLLLGIPALAAATVAHEPKACVRDPAHSQINFVASSRLIDAQGYWDKWDADILFDADAINNSSVTITIDAKSVNTRVEMRDRDLRSNHFFWADSFPVITFKSKTVNAPEGPTRDSLMSNTRVIITGDLTIRGITRTIPVPSTLVFFDRKQNRGRIKGRFTILRRDYDVGYDPPGNPVANEVEVQFDISFRPPAGPRPGH